MKKTTNPTITKKLATRIAIAGGATFAAGIIISVVSLLSVYHLVNEQGFSDTTTSTKQPASIDRQSTVIDIGRIMLYAGLVVSSAGICLYAYLDETQRKKK